MHEDTTSPDTSDERCLLTLRVAQVGAIAPGARGSSRRLSRCLSEAEIAALNERLRLAAVAYLREIAALEAESEEDWVEARDDGSWAVKR